MKYNPRWWFQTFGLFFHNIWNVILPIDKLIFFKMVETTNQLCWLYPCYP